MTKPTKARAEIFAETQVSSEVKVDTATKKITSFESSQLEFTNVVTQGAEIEEFVDTFNEKVETAETEPFPLELSTLDIKVYGIEAMVETFAEKQASDITTIEPTTLFAENTEIQDNAENFTDKLETAQTGTKVIIVAQTPASDLPTIESTTLLI